MSTSPGSREWIAAAVAFAVVLGVDLASKSLADHVGDNRFVDPARNTELAFSLSGRSSGLVLIGASVATVGVLVAAAVLVRRGHLRLMLAVVLAAGLAGNLVDRIAYSGVRDWIRVGPTRWNVADIAQVVGFVALLTAVTRALRFSPTSDSTDAQSERG